MATDESISYRDAGVDIDAGNELVRRIKPWVDRTRRAGVLGSIGGFGGLFEPDLTGISEPVLVSGTDGTGTKIKLAQLLNRHDTIGIDCVAMCVNDVLVQGAEPLFFLDYLATGRLEVDVAADVVRGVATGCEQAGAALIGGETAEMPGMYADGEYDLAGFSVGLADKSRLLPRGVKSGDVAIALASSGFHSNGYSLVRRVIDDSAVDLDEVFEGRPLGEFLLEPTRIYVKSVRQLLQEVPVHALAHITGGGLPENLPRILPDGLSVRVERSALPRPWYIDWIASRARIEDSELMRTFNYGVGFVAVVPEESVDSALRLLDSAGENAWALGSVVSASETDHKFELA